MKILLLMISCLMFIMPAEASMFSSVEDRADQLETNLKGNNSYQAHLARELAFIAVDEKGQHDLAAAKAFIKMAEEHAAQAGGKQ